MYTKKSVTAYEFFCEWVKKPPPSRRCFKFNAAWGPAQTVLQREDELRFIDDELRRVTTELGDLSQNGPNGERRIHLERRRKNLERKRRCLTYSANAIASKITPAKTRRAIDDRAKLRAKCLAVIRENGPPDNITHFIKERLADGSREKERVSRGKIGTGQYSGSTVRTILRNFGVKGRLGINA